MSKKSTANRSANPKSVRMVSESLKRIEKDTRPNIMNLAFIRALVRAAA